MHEYPSQDLTICSEADMDAAIALWCTEEAQAVYALRHAEALVMVARVGEHVVLACDTSAD